MSSTFQAFAGYYGNKEGTEKKILRDVFKKGDHYFRTGDLLRVSSEGYYYFADRMGDTFRWKGENVGTQQVAEALGAILSEASVYGVQRELLSLRDDFVPAVADFSLVGNLFRSPQPRWSSRLRFHPRGGATGQPRAARHARRQVAAQVRAAAVCALC